VVRDGEPTAAQIHTLESFAAVFIIVLSMLFAVQSVAITPTSSSTASQEVELQNYKTADDVLAQANANGTLREAVLDWNQSDGFDGSSGDSRHVRGGNPDNRFGEELGAVFEERGLAYNVVLRCSEENGTKTVRYVRQGTPSKHASTARQTVVLYDEDELNGSTELEEEGASQYRSRVCPDISEETALHNVMEVEVTVWRM